MIIPVLLITLPTTLRFYFSILNILVRHTNRKLLLKSIEEAGLDYEALVQNELCCVTVSDICNPDDGREKNIR